MNPDFINDCYGGIEDFYDLYTFLRKWTKNATSRRAPPPRGYEARRLRRGRYAGLDGAARSAPGRCPAALRSGSPAKNASKSRGCRTYKRTDYTSGTRKGKSCPRNLQNRVPMVRQYVKIRVVFNKTAYRPASDIPTAGGVRHLWRPPAFLAILALGVPDFRTPPAPKGENGTTTRGHEERRK